ncbi:MAG: M3 family metallopeptidase [Muribaculaceae bacterium]|nr:M3 family metallopeptidase [Muribaculaceae bacterium]
MAKSENIFLSEFKTTNGAIPFDKITNSDFEPAILQGIEEQKQQINAIVNQRSVPNFENTILALEQSGKTLSRVLGVFYPYISANSNDELMEISTKLSPVLTAHSTSISLNEKLWERVKFVYDNADKLNLDSEDRMLLEETYISFVRSGANLQGEAREKYRQLNNDISMLTLKFGQNVLKELNTYEIWLEKEDLAGLPESSIEAARTAAKEKGKDGYLITLAAPSYRPFMQYSSRRDLREKLYKMYNSRNTSGEFSNIEIMSQIADKRRQLANIFGYKTFAEYKLSHTMAQNSQNVYNLLNNLRDAYLPAQKNEMKELEKFASTLEGKKVKIEAWDYSYYFNKLKDNKFDLNDEILRPYFELNNVIDGVFGLATKLYGIKFIENHDAQVFNPEVQAFNVIDADGTYLGMIYTDFFPRASKRSGAWMTGFRDQYIDDKGSDVRPLVSITMNFTKPTGSKPSLLTFDEVETFLHEFGHALHGLLSKVKYASLSGTAVYRDFVELPSQFNENYLIEKEFLDSFAKHYETGEAMPQELVDKIIASAQFGAAYACIRQLGFGYLDMAWHTITEPVTDAFAFELNAMKEVQPFSVVEGCLLAPQFSHIFSGGYAAGYYSYKWAEVLEADAFAKFKEDGIFNQETAKSFRDNVLSKGGTEHPMELYKKFRGSEPNIDALLARDGVKKKTNKTRK